MNDNFPATRADLTDDWTRDVCKIGQGAACCRYLTMGADGWDCQKRTTLGSYLDRRVAENRMNARGDNCPGLPKEEASK